MNAATAQKQRLIEWAVAARPLPGQTVSGDLSLVEPFDGGVLVAAIDGIGHGEEATVAAETAMAILKAHAGETMISLVKRCHEALTKTRGVVMSVASVQERDHTLTWLGVGNVEGRLLRADPAASHPKESVLLRGGLVGYQLPALYASVLPLMPGDLLIFATDGIHAGFSEGLNVNESLPQLTERILSRHFKGSDDALVLAARYLGAPDE